MTFLLALLLHLFSLHLAPVAAPAPHGITVSPAAPAPAVAPARHRVISPPVRVSVAPLSPGVSGSKPVPAPVTVPAPPASSSVFGSLPLCDPGQDPTADGCVQGSSPDETTGRGY